MIVARHLLCACLWLVASIAAAQPLIPPTAIDWILVSAHFRVQDAWIDRARQGELYPSDHYPLAALVDWRD